MIVNGAPVDPVMLLILAGLFVFLYREGWRRPVINVPGWGFVVVGSGLLLLGGLLGWLASLDLLVVTDGSLPGRLPGYLARVCTFLGWLLLAVGLFRWVPQVTNLASVETFSQGLTASYTRLELLYQDLRQEWERTGHVSKSANDAIVSAGPDGKISFWNQGARLLFGYTEAEVLGQPLTMLIPERYRAQHNEGIAQVQRTGMTRLAGRTVEFYGVRKSGEEFPIELSLAHWTSRNEHYFVSVIRDISQRRIKERESERIHQSRLAISALLQVALEPVSLEEQLSRALDIILSVTWLSIQAKGSIFLFDEESQELVLTAQQGLADHLLDACARLPMGYCLCGRAAQTREIISSAHIDHRHDVTFDGIKPHGHYCVPILSQERLLGVINTYVPDGHEHDGEEVEFLQAMANTLAGLIERKGAEEKLAHLAHHDTLTGLPNRKLLHERLLQDMARARREGVSLAVMFLDLDRFKAVNDTHGHEVGDKLLKQVAQRLKGCVRESDTVARIGGDEFTVVLSSLPHPENLAVVARKIIAEMNRPFDIDGIDCRIGTSIGVSIHPEHGDDPEVLLKQADGAMYQAKQGGRNDFRVFKPEGAQDSAPSA